MSLSLKNLRQESRLFRVRALAALLFVLLLTLLLALHMGALQIKHHAHYATRSAANRMQLQTIPPARGRIYDRNGVVLAENQPTFALEIILERSPDLDATLEALKPLISWSEGDLARFRKEIKTRRRFTPAPLRFRLSEEEVARFEVNRHRFPGVQVRPQLTRRYPLGEVTAHVTGYVGRISEEDLRTLDAERYRAATHVGKVGLERYYEALLHGVNGSRLVETNARGRILRTLERTPPRPGADLQLTLDSRLQTVADEAMSGRRGALVALDPRDGAVLALVSQPTFDANPFVDGIDRESYRALNDSPYRPLFNRALHGQYPPGSTVKPIIALQAMEQNLLSARRAIFCQGRYEIEGYNHVYRDWSKHGHGRTDMEKAIVESCDIYFYDLSFRMGIDRLHPWLSAFGFGAATGIDMMDERSGLLPSREWKRRARNESWFPGETILVGIGQGFFLTTPLQLAVATATLANRGRRVRPHLLRTTRRSGETIDYPRPPPPAPLRVRVPIHWEQAVNAMEKVVHSRRGTARRLRAGIAYRMAGKTGTSQVFSIGAEEEYDALDLPEHLRDHALFIAFAPADEPRIAVAVVVEHGEHGGGTAAPIARRVIDRFLNNDDQVASLAPLPFATPDRGPYNPSIRR